MTTQTSKPKTKIDMRFNEIRDAIQEISNAVRNCPLTNEAIAALISSKKNAPNKTQVLNVLYELERLEKNYLKSGR